MPQPTPNPGVKPDQPPSGPSPITPVPAVINPEAGGGDQLNESIVEDQVACSCLCRRRQQSMEPKKRKEYPIEYFIINLMKMRKKKESEVTDVKAKEVSQRNEYSVTHRRGVTELILHLANKDEDILEIETIKAIIEFKWEAYTKGFFSIQLFLMLIFTVAFFVDVIAIADNPKQLHKDDLKQFVPRIICMVILFFLSIYEVIDFFINPLSYFRRYWNLNDQLLFFLYLSYFILSFVDPTQL
jgi:hypothetical protein